MYSIALKEAQSQLEALTAKVVTDEEVIITDDKGMIFQLSLKNSSPNSVALKA